MHNAYVDDGMITNVCFAFVGYSLHSCVRCFAILDGNITVIVSCFSIFVDMPGEECAAELSPSGT